MMGRIRRTIVARLERAPVVGAWLGFTVTHKSGRDLEDPAQGGNWRGRWGFYTKTS